jgi:hypothetical protein
MTTTAEQPSAEPRVVLVLREDLPVPLAVNAAAVLGASTGSRLGLPLGPAGTDASGTAYPGIVTTPVPVLVADHHTLGRVFRDAAGDGRVDVVCLTGTAQRARTYEAYLDDLAATPDADHDLLAVLVAGPRGRVTKHTKRLSLLGAAG